MKKFIFTILSVSVFFLGLGGLVDRAGAKFKSDDKALMIIAQARQAIGGEAAINGVRSLTMKATTTQILNFDGTSRTEQGDTEIALELPNKFIKMVRIGKAGDGTENVNFSQQSNILIKRNDGDAPEKARKIVIVNNHGGENEMIVGPENNDANDKQMRKVIVKQTEDVGGVRQNELLRTTFALLLSAPEGTDASYTYAGENSVDGNKCDVILVSSGGDSFKLSIDKSTHLPLMLSYQSPAPMFFKIDEAAAAKSTDDQNVKTVIINKDGEKSDGKKTVRVFKRTAGEPLATAEYQVKFSDFRTVGGVQLPYKWTQTIDGKPDQNVDVSDYEINPVNIEQKFQQPVQKVMK